MPSRRVLLIVALVAGFAMLAAACSSGSSSNGSSTTSSSTATATTVPISTGELVDGLAGSGIGVYETPAATQPARAVTNPGPVKLLEWQAANLAREASVGGGYAGAQLDALAPMPRGAPPMSYLVAAYVQSGTTKGAELSRRLMGARDWKQAPGIVFPNTVLLLFADDAAMPAGATDVKPAMAPGAPTDRSSITAPTGSAAVLAGITPSAVLDTPTGICSALSTWVSDVIGALFDALKVDTSGGGVGGFLGSIWNAAVDLAKGAVGGLITVLTAPVLAAVKSALAVLGTLAMAASLLHPASVSVTSDPDPIAYGIDPGAGSVGVFTTKVTTGAPEWPADLLDCAQQAGVTLPNPAAIKDSPVTWTTTGLPPLGTEEKHDSALDANGKASLTYRTNTESKEAADTGAVINETVTAKVSVERNDIKDLQKLLATLLFNVIPGPGGQIIGSILAQLTQPVFEALAALVAVIGSGAATVVHHGPPAPKDKDPGTTGCVGSGTGVIPDGVWTGPIAFDTTGQAAPVSGSVQSTGGGTLTMTIKNGTVIDGTWSVAFDSTGSVQTKGGSGTIRSMHVDITGGAVSGPASAPVLTGTSTLNGVIDVTAGGFSMSVPINESGPANATMTVQQAACAQVIATFIPSFNATGGGVATFSGTATWTGSAG